MSFTDAEELKTMLVSMDTSDFVSRYLFEPVPHIFGTDLGLWISWKKTLASYLHVDPYDMILTGSSAIGYSLNPYKDYASYHADSDIDVGVISSHHFEVAWRYLRQSRPSWLSLSSRMRNALTSHQKNFVFSGTIATDKILSLLPFGVSWQKGLDEMASHNPTMGKEVNLRIYRDYDSLRFYQKSGLEKLKTELLESTPTEEDIPIQED